MATWRVRDTSGGGSLEHTRQLKITSSEYGGLTLQSAYPHTPADGDRPSDSCAFGDGVAELRLQLHELATLRGALGIGEVAFRNETGIPIDPVLSIGRNDDGSPRFVIELRRSDERTRPPGGAPIGALYLDGETHDRPNPTPKKRGRPPGKRGAKKKLRRSSAPAGD